MIDGVKLNRVTGAWGSGGIIVGRGRSLLEQADGGEGNDKREISRGKFQIGGNIDIDATVLFLNSM